MSDQTELEVSDPGPGVHLVVHDDPEHAARVVARSIGGQVVDVPVVAGSALAQRARLPVVRAVRARLDRVEELAAGIDCATIDNDRALAEQRPVLAAVAARTPPRPGDAERLRRLAVELAAVERARADVADMVRARIAAVTGDPIGPGPRPDPARVLARAVEAAEEAAVTDARLALDLLDPRIADEPATPAPTAGRTGTEPRPGTEPDDAAGPHDDIATDDGAEGADARRDGPGQGPPPDEPVPRTAAERDATPSDDDADHEAEALARWDPDDPANAISPYDSSVLLPLGIVLIGVSAASMVVLLGWPTPVTVVVMAVAVVVAGLTRKGIKEETRERLARAAAGLDPDAPLPGDGSHDDPIATDDDTDEVADPSDTRAEATGEPPEDDPEDVDLSGPADPHGPTWREHRAGLLAAAEGRLAAARLTLSSRTFEPEPAQGPDPIVERAVCAAPEIRVLDAALAERRRAWQDEWRRLGRDDVLPDPGVVDLVLADLAECGPDPAEAGRALDGLQEAEAHLERAEELERALGHDTLAGLRAGAPTEDDLDDGPLVLVEPFTGLGDQRRRELRMLLDEIPDDITVVVVVRSAEDVPES